jgi:ubiquinone/menaquinone biosynthesis C-methylase UbiE
MAEASRHDAWQAGSSYDLYMGRWSRQIAPEFLDWLDISNGLDWLEVGCGTGALSAAILRRWKPTSLHSIDPSEGFIATARQNVTDSRATFAVGDAQALAVESASKDVVVSALVLNFIPDRVKALAEMKRVTRQGGTIAFYVWDYPGGGMQVMREFWTAATALDPAASDLTEDKRFPFCTPEGLTALVKQVGMISIAQRAIEMPAIFTDFDDYWRPFTLGAGPAPGYCVKLSPDARERLRQKLSDTLPRQDDGSITLKLRAWAVKAKVP